MSVKSCFAGIDVAFAKGKRLPIVVCTWQNDRLVPEALRRLPFEPPVGLGNAQSCIPDVVDAFARSAVDYLRRVEDHLGLKIVRIGIDAPSEPRPHTLRRRAAEAALDAAGISCFATPSIDDFSEIRLKVQRHLAAGGEESRLPHANQLWMQVGFVLFRELRAIADCVEVYPQATVRQLGVGSIHKFKAGGVDAQLAAVAAVTGWPSEYSSDPDISEIAWGKTDDQLDAYLAAWVAGLEVVDRHAFGKPPDDVIWVPNVKGGTHAVSGPSFHMAARPARIPLPAPREPRPLKCPACAAMFRNFPLGWDGHAAHKCSGLVARDPEARKHEFKERFGHLFVRGRNPEANSKVAMAHREHPMNQSERFRGCLLGLAVGDAVGTTVEFRRRGTFDPLTDMVGGGPFNLQPGQWTDDTSMVLCLATSLVERGGFDTRDQMDRYCQWADHGYLSSTGICFDIGTTVASALRRYQRDGNPYAGSTDPNTAGNGCIMRLAPIPMYFFPDLDALERFAGESSRTTHGATECIDASRLFARIICRALLGKPKDDVLLGDSELLVSGESMAAIARGAYRGKSEAEIRGSGYVVESLEAALWAFARAESFEEAILIAANLGEDADTTAAVCGQVAGAYYGELGIPTDWLERLAFRSDITELADQLSVKTRT